MFCSRANKHWRGKGSSPPFSTLCAMTVLCPVQYQYLLNILWSSLLFIIIVKLTITKSVPHSTKGWWVVDNQTFCFHCFLCLSLLWWNTSHCVTPGSYGLMDGWINEWMNTLKHRDLIIKWFWKYIKFQKELRERNLFKWEILSQQKYSLLQIRWPIHYFKEKMSHEKTNYFLATKGRY